MPDNFYELPIALQVAIGGGFLAYMLASAGIRQSHGPLDVIMRTTAFGIPAAVVYPAASASFPVWLAAIVSLASCLVIAALWRAWIASLVVRMIGVLRIHGDDYLDTAWESLISQRQLRVTQINVRLKSGVELFCEDLTPYCESPDRGLILGNDGSVVMVVDIEASKDGTEHRREDIMSEEYGVRMTYVPADEIEYVDLRRF